MPHLGDLEAAVMDVMWRASGALTVREVREKLSPERTVAYTTVMTVLDTLHRKGWLHRRREGRAWRYFAAADREDYVAGLLTEALSATDDHAGAFARFVDRMDEGDAERLRRALDGHRRER